MAHHRRVLVAVCVCALLWGSSARLSATSWPNTCGDGRVDAVIDDFDAPWTICCTAGPSIPPPVLHIVPGCHGNALAVDYDLTNVDAGQSWVVIIKQLPAPIDLSNRTKIRLAIRGSAGNVGWTVIALARLQGAGVYTDAASLTNAIARGADWIARQSSERGDPAYPHLITLGIEGNISAYFGLRAAGRHSAAALLADAIFQFGWDPIERRMKPGVTDAATAIDVAGSWGATFLRSIGRSQEALDSQAYAATVMRTSSFDGATDGYGDIAGPFTPPVEFTAQAGAAGIAGADSAVQQMLTLQTSDGTFHGAADHWYGGALNPWVTTMTGVSPTAWMYFALSTDPLLELAPPFTDDPLIIGSTVIEAVHVTEMRNALAAVYAAAGVTAPTYTDSVLIPGVTPVRAVHIAELRTAVLAIE